MKKIFWDDWFQHKIVCDYCLLEHGFEQWLEPGGYQLTAFEKAIIWQTAQEELERATHCDICKQEFSSQRQPVSSLA